MKKCFAPLKKATVFILTAVVYVKNVRFTKNTGSIIMIIALKPAVCKVNKYAASQAV